MSAPEHVEGQMPLLPPADPDPAPLTAVPDVDPDADVTLVCDEPGCGEQVTGKAGGRNSANFQLGRHKRSAHTGKAKKAAPRRRGTKTPTQPTAAELRFPGVAAVADAAEEVGGKGTPSAANLARGIGTLLSTASGMAASWAVDSDPAISAARASNLTQVSEEAENQSAQLVAALTITPQSAERIMKPIARLIAPSGLNAKYGRVLVENTDLGPALAELVEIGRNWREFLAVRREHVEETRALRLAQAEAAAPPYVAPTPAAQEAAAAASPAGGRGTEPLGRGLVAVPNVRSTP